MIRKDASLYLWALLVILSAAQITHFYPALPLKVASHFNVNGRPDSWMNKSSFVAFHAFIIAAISAMFFLTGFFLRKIPVALLNLPNKDYWLMPEKREDTYSFFQSFLFWFADITLIFFLFLFQNIYLYATNHTVNLGSSFFYYIIVYLICIGITGYLFIRHFIKISE